MDPSARQIKPSSPLPNPVAPGVVLNASTLLAALEMLESADDSSHADGAPTQVVFLPNGSISIPTPGGNSTTAPQDASPVVVQDLDQAAGSGDGDGDFDDQELSRLSPEHGADLGATSSQSPGFFNGEEGTPATRPSVPVMTGASLVVHAPPAPPLPPARALPPAPAPGEPSPAPEPSPESVGSATETVTALSPERNSSREGPLPLPYPKSSVDGSGKSQTIAIAVSASVGGFVGLLLLASIPLVIWLVRRRRAWLREQSRLSSGSDLEAGLGSGRRSSSPLAKPAPGDRGDGDGSLSTRPSTGMLGLLPLLGLGAREAPSRMQFMVSGGGGAGRDPSRRGIGSSDGGARLGDGGPSGAASAQTPRSGMARGGGGGRSSSLTDSVSPPSPSSGAAPPAPAMVEDLLEDELAPQRSAASSQLWPGGSGALPWTDGRVSAEEITIVLRPDGSPWLLGAGAYGRVYRALRDGVQPVAVKVLTGMENSRRRDEFIREVTLLRSCRDHNIVQFIGACIQGEEAMLVTEFMEFGDLWRAATLRSPRGDRIFGWWGRGRKVALDIARGLHFLHSRSIVHLDLKSANVLLMRDGTAKIADVGFARVMSKSYMLSSTGGLGTFAWSAPEMLFGDRCSAKSDIYSFGIVLWEIVTGETPLRGDMRPMRVPEECSQGVVDLFDACLAQDPSARPDTRSLVTRIQELLDEPVQGAAHGAELDAAGDRGGGRPAAAAAQGPRGSAAPAQVPDAARARADAPPAADA